MLVAKRPQGAAIDIVAYEDCDEFAQIFLTQGSLYRYMQFAPLSAHLQHRRNRLEPPEEVIFVHLAVVSWSIDYENVLFVLIRHNSPAPTLARPGLWCR